MAKSFQIKLGDITMWAFNYLGLNLWELEFVDAQGHTLYETTQPNAQQLSIEEAQSIYETLVKRQG